MVRVAAASRQLEVSVLELELAIHAVTVRTADGMKWPLLSAIVLHDSGSVTHVFAIVVRSLRDGIHSG